MHPLVPALLILLGGTAGELPVPALDIQDYLLENGLEVILHPDRTWPTAAVSVWYKVGSGDEQPGRTGLAHLCEHLMFQGSANHDADHFAAIQDLGGEANANTNHDRTTYWETFPAEALERVLWLEADRMGALIPALTREKVAKQQSIIANEMAEDQARAYSGVRERVLQLLHPQGHPYAWPVSGNADDRAAAGLEDVVDFLRAHYRPGNAILCVAGDFDPEQVRAWIRRSFGPIPAGQPAPAAAGSGARPAGPGRSVMRTGTEPRLVMAWRTPGWYRPGDAEFDLLADLLAGGRASLLHRILVQDRKLARDVSARQDSRLRGGVFSITVTAAGAEDLPDLEQEVAGALARIMDEGLDADDVERARVRRHVDFLRRLEDVGGPSGRTELLAGYAFFAGRPNDLDQDLTRYLEATPEGITAAARRWLRPDSCAVLHCVPETEPEPQPEAVLPPPSGGTTPPPIPDPSPFQPPPIRRATLVNGLELYLVRRAGLPLTEVHLTVPKPASDAPVDSPWIAGFTAAMLDEGAGSRDALAIAEEVRSLGARLRTYSSMDGATVALNLPTPALGRGLSLLADMVIRPVFPGEEFDRLRENYRHRQGRDLSDPARRGIIEVQRRIFGPDHPYGAPYTGCGTSEELAAVTVENLREYHRRWYRPGHAFVVLVGDLDPERAVAALDEAFGGWEAAPAPAIRPAVPSGDSGPRFLVIDRPGLDQVHIAGGLLLPEAGHPDHTALVLANAILGGQPSSRINDDLRGGLGATYGARTRYLALREAGLMLVTAAVSCGQLGEALAAIASAFDGLGDSSPATGPELAAARRALDQDFARDFATLAGAAEALDRYVLRGSNPAAWEDHAAALEKTRPGDLTRAVAESLPSQGVRWVLIGPQETIKKQLNSRGLGDDEAPE